MSVKSTGSTKCANAHPDDCMSSLSKGVDKVQQEEQVAQNRTFVLSAMSLKMQTVFVSMSWFRC